MATKDRARIAHDMYEAFAAGDRDAIESMIAEDFRFHAPPDPDLDRAGYFERCWPNSGNGGSFDFTRVVENGDELIVTYESTRSDGTRGRNTEILTFDGDRIREVEVYFGWELEDRAPG